MNKLEILKQVVKERRTEKKVQLKTAFKMILTDLVAKVRDNGSYAGSSSELVAIEDSTNILLKEVSIRTDLR